MGSRESCIRRDIKLSSQSESKQGIPLNPGSTIFLFPAASFPEMAVRSFFPRSFFQTFSALLVHQEDIRKAARGTIHTHTQSSVLQFYGSARKLLLQKVIPSNRDEIPLSIVFAFSIPRLEELLSLFRSAIAIGYLSKKIDESPALVELKFRRTRSINLIRSGFDVLCKLIMINSIAI